MLHELTQLSFDRKLMLVVLWPTVVISTGLQVSGVLDATAAPLGLGWIGVALPHAAFWAAVYAGTLALFASTPAGRWHAAVRAAWSVVMFAVATGDLLGKMHIIIVGLLNDFRAQQYFREEWTSVRAVAASIIDLESSLFYAASAAGLTGLAVWRLANRSGPAATPGPPVRRAVPLALLSGALLIASCVLPGPGSVAKSAYMHPVSWMLTTALRADWPEPARQPPAAAAKSLRLERDAPLNLVVIVLESVGRSVTSLDGGSPELTPNLERIAAASLDFQRTYAVVPHSTKSTVATMCGSTPWLSQRVVETRPDGLPFDCLPRQLSGFGYRTAYFSSTTESFEEHRELVANVGFEEFYPLEALSPAGFEPVNYFGYEDDILLGPSREWIRREPERPFFLMYNTGTPHHDYRLPDKYIEERFSDDPQRNSYLNAVRYVDRFVGKVFAQLREDDLLQDTVVVIIGDHGESFEAPVRFHDLALSETVLRVPFLLHHQDHFVGARTEPVSHLDLRDTALEALGFTVSPSSSLLRGTAPADPGMRFSACWHVRRCVSVLQGDYRLLHSFDERDDVLYDVVLDPDHEHNLLREQPARAAELRAAAEAWYAEHIAWARWMVEEHW